MTTFPFLPFMLNDAYVAIIGSDGLLGTWTRTTDLPAAREWHSALARGGYLYVLGGLSGTGFANQPVAGVEVAPIHSDGSLKVHPARLLPGRCVPGRHPGHVSRERPVPRSWHL
jgi:hypothetical protein